MRYMNNTEEAEDVMSQGFTKVFSSIQNLEYRDINSLRAWIKRIMINESLMQLRKSVNFLLVSIDEAEDITYQDQNMHKLETGYIINALSELPLGYKTILNLYAIEGYTHSEIASMLNINEGTSRSQLSKARNMMKDKLNAKTDQYGNGKA
jgi:RNA polymerase sigma-70 factor (ECF subfamily)